MNVNHPKKVGPSSRLCCSKFTINGNKDRGNNPDGSDRENDVHLTNAEKRSGRGGQEG